MNIVCQCEFPDWDIPWGCEHEICKICGERIGEE